jgi:hypothetical protein
MRVHALSFSRTEAPELAIRIMLTSDGTHAGLLYRFQNDLFHLDLLWHENLRIAKVGANDQAMSCVIPDFLPEEMFDATITCELIVNRKFSGRGQRAPYGFGMPQDVQINDDGELIWGGGVGLTCSTFVLAVFEAARIPFIDLCGWRPRPLDDQRHADLLRRMEEGIPEYGIPPAPRDHIEKVRQELPCVRVRPEEVAAVGLSPERPAQFELTARTGLWILDWLRLGPSRAEV